MMVRDITKLKSIIIVIDCELIVYAHLLERNKEKYNLFTKKKSYATRAGSMEEVIINLRMEGHQEPIFGLLPEYNRLGMFMLDTNEIGDWTVCRYFDLIDKGNI